MIQNSLFWRSDVLRSIYICHQALEKACLQEVLQSEMMIEIHESISCDGKTRAHQHEPQICRTHWSAECTQWSCVSLSWGAWVTWVTLHTQQAVYAVAGILYIARYISTLLQRGVELSIRIDFALFALTCLVPSLPLKLSEVQTQTAYLARLWVALWP